MPKLRSCVLATIFRTGNRCTTLVEHILYMFAAFTSLNTVNIDVATVPECIPCMI